MSEGDKKHYSFLSPNGRAYVYRRCPFGGRLITHYLRSLKAGVLAKNEPNIAYYVDDISLFSDNEKEHKTLVETFLERLSDANLGLNPSKSVFFKSKISIFGYDVDQSGYKPTQARIEKLLSLKTPENWKALRKAVAWVAYFRPCIPKFAHAARQIFEWARENSNYDGSSPEAKEAWKALLNQVASRILLSKPDLSKEFCLRTDASTYAYGSVLSQLDTSGEETIIAVDSRQFTKSQRSWYIPTKELWSSASGVRFHAGFLLGRHFRLITDNQSVYHTIKGGKHLDITTSNPIARSILFLNTFDFTIEWSKGSVESFHLTFLLSRKIINMDSEIKISQKSKEPFLQVKDVLGNWRSVEPDDFKTNGDSSKEPFTLSALHITVPEATLDANELRKGIKKSQSECPKIQKRIKKILNGTILKRFSVIRDAEVNSNVLLHETSIVIPNHKVIDVLSKLHNHTTNLATIQKLESLGLWLEYMNRTTKFNQVVNDVRAPFVRCHLDNISVKPLYAVVCIDSFSGYVELAALASDKIEDTIEVVTKLLLRMNLPQELIIDNARTFRSPMFQDSCKNLGVAITHTSPRNSRSNGKVERANKKVQERLATLTGNNQIPLYLTFSELDTICNLISFELNHTKPKEGFAPVEIIQGQQPNFGLRLPPKFHSSSNKDYVKLLETELKKVRQTLLDKLDEDIKNLGEVHKIKFEIKDRIKIEPKPNTPKRGQTKWSEEEYEILEINPSHNTAKLRKIIDTKDGRVRSNRILIAIDRLRRITDVNDLKKRKGGGVIENEVSTKSKSDPLKSLGPVRLTRRRR